MHAATSSPDIALIRSETPNERTARCAAEAPVRAFLVVETYPGSGAAVIREVDLPGCARLNIVRDLAAGQWDRPHRILFVDEIAGICRDASAEIAGLLTADPDLSLSAAARDFCVRHVAAPQSSA